MGKARTTAHKAKEKEGYTTNMKIEALRGDLNTDVERLEAKIGELEYQVEQMKKKHSLEHPDKFILWFEQAVDEQMKEKIEGILEELEIHAKVISGIKCPQFVTVR